ncbi:hypothetical protein [Mesobacterium pallidum]|uniref:hypothetical protein n=1 Tax=Mesobacterium pallidum TaxID=2872037 RepID=UPI001EE16D9B|nr:hypothetical protein [Mesobacterium pallidum]
MMHDDAARRALIERQGPGARYDAPNAPADDLLAARRATAEAARLLNDLTDAALVAGRETPGAQAQVIAQVALQARRMGEFIAARAGALEPTSADITEAAHLPAHALRHLFDHTRAHLNVEWRELTDADWDRTDLRALPALRHAQLTRAIDALIRHGTHRRR